MSTSVSSVVSHFPSAENGFATTTSGSVSSGATSVGLNSVAGYTNGEVAVFIIDPDDATKKQTFTGTIDTGGVQVTDVVWTAGTNQTHAAGATVVDYASATHISMISKGILVHANQDGTIKDGAISSAAMLSNNVVTSAKIMDANVTTAKLADDSVTAAKLDGVDKSLLTTDSNPYKFSVYLAADQTGVADATPTKILFDTEKFDTNSNFASNKYTVPVNGFYQINAYIGAVSVNNTGVAAVGLLYKNGAEFIRADSGYASATTNMSLLTMNINDIIQLTAGDTIELYVSMDVVSSTTTVLGGAAWTRLSGFLASRT